MCSQTRLNGISTNLDYAHSVISDERFAQMQIWTRLLDDFDYVPNVIEVLQAGTQSSIQDFPGRVGYWDIGVPPSGPMDDYAFQLANQIVGNDASAAGFEFHPTRPKSQVSPRHCDCTHRCTMPCATRR